MEIRSHPVAERSIGMAGREELVGRTLVNRPVEVIPNAAYRTTCPLFKQFLDGLAINRSRLIELRQRHPRIFRIVGCVKVERRLRCSDYGTFQEAFVDIADLFDVERKI